MIRRAENRDIPDVERLLLQVGNLHHRGRPDLFRADTPKYTPGELEAIFADDSRPVFVLTEDGGGPVLGYAFCVFQRHGAGVLTDILTLYIDDLCVDEACRGQGIGRKLYEHAAAFAKAQGCYNLTLNVWETNTAARRFYERMGLQPQKTGLETIL